MELSLRFRVTPYSDGRSTRPMLLCLAAWQNYSSETRYIIILSLVNIILNAPLPLLHIEIQPILNLPHRLALAGP